MGLCQTQSTQLLPKYEKVSSIVNGPRCNPLGPISKLVEAVVDVPDELPADGKLSLDVSREEVLGPRSQLTVHEFISNTLSGFL